MKILIVEDNKHIQRLYKEELEEEGYEVVIAGTGRNALELFEKENPDIVTLDILMPDIDSINLFKKMKEQQPEIPIIMSTAYDYQNDFAVRVSEAYVVKLADLNKLKGIIKKFFNGRKT